MSSRRTRSCGVVCCLLLLACGSNEVPDRPTPSPTLSNKLRAATPDNPEQDYWTESLGHYMTPGELHDYWVTPRERRFSEFGDRWLEFCLREDLLRDHRTKLRDAELDAFSAQPDFDASQRYLKKLLPGTKGRKKDR